MLNATIVIGYSIICLSHAVHVLFDQSTVSRFSAIFPTRGCWNGFYGIIETGIITVPATCVVSQAISAIVHVMFMLYCLVKSFSYVSETCCTCNYLSNLQ